MAANLRDRLKRIHEVRKIEQRFEAPVDNEENCSKLINLGWKPCGYKTLKREVDADSPFEKDSSMPSALAVLVPDLAGKPLPEIGDFLFFDLETTGLSGGAGTMAFLAAFGKPFPNGKLRITQYLLLDYPGENDFLQNVLARLNKEKEVIVTYNGKCFDSQIIKSRCLMNRIKPPEYWHVDLLHPSRRLWKNIIQDCSQTSIERNILGIDRVKDIPGSLAPEIWFEFLKTGETDRLMGICDHNLSDISGLASILSAMITIAKTPIDNEKYRYDIERLALYWRQYLKRQDFSYNDEIKKTGEKLLKYAAENDFKRAVYIYSFEQMKNGSYDEALKFVLRGLKIFNNESDKFDILKRRKESLKKKLDN
jgi:uncharacterized protein YprB with RNaseH-like and TPR domain